MAGSGKLVARTLTKHPAQFNKVNAPKVEQRDAEGGLKKVAEGADAAEWQPIAPDHAPLADALDALHLAGAHATSD